jgi:hypothetical protein
MSEALEIPTEIREASAALATAVRLRAMTQADPEAFMDKAKEYIRNLGPTTDSTVFGHQLIAFAEAFGMQKELQVWAHALTGKRKAN